MADVNVKVQQLFNFWSVYQDQNQPTQSSQIVEPPSLNQTQLLFSPNNKVTAPSSSSFSNHFDNSLATNVLNQLQDNNGSSLLSQKMSLASSSSSSLIQPNQQLSQQTIDLFQSVYEQTITNHNVNNNHHNNNNHTDNNNSASIISNNNNNCSIENIYHNTNATTTTNTNNNVNNNVSNLQLSSAPSPSTFDLNSFLLSASSSSPIPVPAAAVQKKSRRSTTKKVAQNSPLTVSFNHLNNSPSQTDSELFEYIIGEFKIPGEILDDLASRFILNMPQEEKDDPIRICFQIEIAYWFYLDFYCESISELPRYKLKRFAFIMFSYIPRLRKLLNVFDQVITNWIDYKFSIPCSGAVLLDKTMNYVLLVQGYGSKNWSFPKGKVNHDETLMNCAIREVMEETGYDCTDKIRDGIYLERKIFESRVRLFIVIGVEMDFSFRPHVRNEIRAIQWFLMQDLPMKVQKKIHSANFASKFFTVLPFVYNIRKWIDKERKRQKKEAKNQRRRIRMSSNETDDSQKDSNGDSGSCGDGSNAGWEIDETNGSCNIVNRDLTASVSPFTIVEDQNESTSFVDVKLDDILDLSYSSNVSKQQTTIMKDQSVTGFNVFNADEDDYESDAKKDADSVSSTSSSSVPNNKQQQQQQWQTNWQGLLSEYNRLSLTNGNNNNNNESQPMTSPFNNSISQQPPQQHHPQQSNSIVNVQSSVPQSILSPNLNHSPMMNGVGGNSHSLLSNLILNSSTLVASKDDSHQHAAAAAAAAVIPSTPLPLFNSINSCDDKLSLLFGITQNHNNTNANNNISSLSFNNGNIGSGFTGQSPFNSTKTSVQPPSPIVNSFNSFNSSNNSNNNLSPFARVSNNGNQSVSSPLLNNNNNNTTTSSKLMPNIRQSSSNSVVSPAASAPSAAAINSSNQLNNSSLQYNGISNGKVQSQSSFIVKPIGTIGTPSPFVNRYNGLDQKNLPLVETKIQQLLERFKILNAN